VIKTIYIWDKITNDLSLSQDGYLTYLSLLMIQKKDRNLYYVTPSLLSYFVNGRYPPTRQDTQHIISGINELINHKTITVQESNKKNEWIIDTAAMTSINQKYKKSKADFYTGIYEDEITTILLSNNKHYDSCVSLLRFYIYLLSTLHKNKCDKQDIGYKPLKEIVKEVSISKNTILSYFNKLEELKLIYIYRPKDTILYDNGLIREISNTYGRYRNKEKIINVGKSFARSYGFKSNKQFDTINREKCGKTSGASQKYNYILRCIKNNKPIPYDYNECKDIYSSMVFYNQKYKADTNRKKDLSIFREYDFFKS
jgi:hypothetical protein